jgi:hypothetical protein
VGIEMGQLAFIALLVVIAFLGNRLAGQLASRLRPMPVYVLGGLSAMWCVERGLDVLF